MKNKYLETIKVVDGKIFYIEYHQQRYESVLSDLGSNEPKELTNYINPPQNGLYRCRVVYDATQIDVSYHQYEQKKITSLQLVYDDTLTYTKKSLYRDPIQRLYNQRGECDEVLIIKNSLVSDTSIANVAFYKDGRWYTPKKPLLEGTTRKRYLDEGKLEEVDIKVDDIKDFSKIAFLNAMVDFYSVDDCKILL